MSGTTNRTSISKTAALIAMIVGIAAGSYGVAAAATGSSSNSASTTATPAASSAPSTAATSTPWGTSAATRRCSPETLSRR